MTDPMELVGRLEIDIPIDLDSTASAKAAIIQANIERYQAAACIREMAAFVPAISLDGPNLPDEHRVWLARQLFDSKLTDDEAYSIVRHSPAVTNLPPAPGAEA